MQSLRKIYGSILVLFAFVVVASLVTPAQAADLVTLSPDNYEAFAPKGKEARAFFGDYVLRNDKITLAVADPKLMSGRSASRWSIANVSGALIDLTRLDSPSGDMLRAYYPGPFRFKPDAPNFAPEFVSELDAHKQPGRGPQHAKRVTLTVAAYELGSGKMLDELAKLPPNVRGSPKPSLEVAYILEDGWDFVLVECTYTNPTDKPFNAASTETPGAPSGLQTLLRADDTREQGSDFGGKLVFLYDTSWRFAYGVLAEGHALAAQKVNAVGMRIGHVDKNSLVIPPGKSLKITRRLIPAENVFQLKTIAAGILGTQLRQVPLEVAAPDGPVADALITVRTASDDLIGSARTGADGKVMLALPAEDVTISWTTPRDPLRPAREAAANTVRVAKTQDKVILDAPAKSGVSAAVADDTGQPLACKVRFHAPGFEPLQFFPDTGDRAVKNLRYSENGQFIQTLPPGKYTLTFTAGPEFDFLSQEVEVAPGKITQLKIALPRRVDSTGWISADTHSHTAVSGPQDQFFVYPYTPCATTDGASFASPLGRVLNLLGEGIEFAPTADHNFVTSFEPYLKELRAESKMATVPGIGLTAGRRHTVNHQNSFPVPFVRGAQDGGAIQRPEHVAQITWLSQWNNSAEKLIQMSQPCESQLAITPEVDVLDLQHLAPIVDGKPIKGMEDRVLDWVAALNKGYRLPAVVTSNAYTNYHGSGGVRTYVQSSTDEPAKINAMEIVRALKRGRAVMTTGPFMQVWIVTPDKKEIDPPATADSLRAENGKVSLHIRVQSSNWATIDRVQILVNGERDASRDYSRSSHPKMFAAGATPFDQVVTVDLKSDAHLIVVASGRGPNLRDSASEPIHVAVANPIFVDVGKKGYEPASPLEDKVAASLEFSRPLLTRLDAPTGHVRLTLRNTSDIVSEDSATLETLPENAVKIIGNATKKYVVAPGGETFVEWELLFTPEFLQQKFPIRSTYNNANTFGVRVARSDKAPGRRPSARWMDVDNSMRLLPPIASLDEVAQAVKDEVPLLVKNPRNEQTVSELRMGVSGDQLALHARVTDAKMTRKEVIWEGSCIEVFGAMGLRDFTSPEVWGGYRAISQLFLLPAVGAAPDAVMKQVKDKIVPHSSVRMKSTPIDKGYEMVALIPLADLGINVDSIARAVYFGGQSVPAAVLGLDPTVGRFRMEVRVTGAVNAAGDSQRGQLFRAGAPHVDHHDYGQFRLEAPVKASMELISPVAFSDKPGKVRMTLTNTGSRKAAGKTGVRIEPDWAAKITGESMCAFELAPGAKATFDFDVAASAKTTSPASAIDFVVTRAADGSVMTTPALTVPILHRPMLKLKSAAALDGVAAALAAAEEYRIFSANVPIVSLRLGISGNNLALLADVVDLKVTQNATAWKGSCFEIFAEGDAKKITQIFLQPAADGKPARALLAGGEPTPVNGAQVRTTPKEKGYRIEALIPLASLNTDAAHPALEFQITATDENDKVRRGTLFGSPRAYQDSQRYGRFESRE